MYGINGEKMLTEETLNHLSGYKNSSPVRVGNAAFIQKQMIYMAFWLTLFTIK